MEHTILCVDDEIDIVDSLERLFRKKYKVLKATSGQEGLALLKQHSVSAIITDQRMPEMTGVKFLEKSLKSAPDAVRILLTGYTDIESVIDAINSAQIYRYITKPWDSRELSLAVDRAVERFELQETLKVKNQELAAANQELLTLDHAKSNFMILINHELKTPLTSMLSFLELLKETTLDDDQTKYMSRIFKSAERLQQLIFDVLELVSAETGQLKIKSQKLNDETILEKVLEKVPAHEAKIKMALEGVDFRADSNLTEKVLQRLIENALQHGGGKPVYISTKKTDAGLIFSVKNSGNLSRETIQAVLKPFTTNENIMHHSKGVGLGLSISRALLKVQGSFLEISSSESAVNCQFSFPIAE